MQTLTPGTPDARGALARFQDAFAHALLASGATPASDVAALSAQPAFAVYRNTVMKGCIDALQANYPAVLKLVGEEWFRAAAANHVRAALPSDPTLLRYGTDFAAFLACFELAKALPYLPGVASLYRLWTECHTARDQHALDPAIVAGLVPEVLAGTVLHPHATARWAWFPDAPVYTIWSRNRSHAARGSGCAVVETDDMIDIAWKAEGALLLRPGDTVEWTALDAAGCAFLDTCSAGGTLAAAAASAIDVRGNTDLERLMATLFAAGAFGGMSVADE